MRRVEALAVCVVFPHVARPARWVPDVKVHLVADVGVIVVRHAQEHIPRCAVLRVGGDSPQCRCPTVADAIAGGGEGRRDRVLVLLDGVLGGGHEVDVERREVAVVEAIRLGGPVRLREHELAHAVAVFVALVRLDAEVDVTLRHLVRSPSETRHSAVLEGVPAGGGRRR